MERLADIGAIVALEDYHAHLTAAVAEAGLVASASRGGGRSASPEVHARMAANEEAYTAALQRQGELAATAVDVRNDVMLHHDRYTAKYGGPVPIDSALVPHSATM